MRDTLHSSKAFVRDPEVKGFPFRNIARAQGSFWLAIGARGLIIRPKFHIIPGEKSGMKLLEWLDYHEFLNIRLWDFSCRSLFTAYGKAFLSKAVIRHPLKAVRGFRRYQRLVKSGLWKQEPLTHLSCQQWEGGKGSVVGVGFCLKPLDPSCLSGRPNHSCYFLENNLHLSNGKIPECCFRCPIKTYGLLALGKGSSYYVMTSAIDILHDLFLPALQQQRYQRGLFTLCRYSFNPFVLPLLMANMEFAIFPFESGDCRDYPTWWKADVGVKDEQTVIAPQNRKTIQGFLSSSREVVQPNRSYHKEGNVFHPV